MEQVLVIAERAYRTSDAKTDHRLGYGAMAILPGCSARQAGVARGATGKNCPGSALMKFSALAGLLLGACCTLACSNQGPGIASRPSVPQGITEENLLRHIQILASDEFEGRAPGTHGDQLAVDYITEQFKRGGLQPGNPDGTFLQAVPLVGTKSTPRASVTVGGKKTLLQYPTDYVARSYWVEPEIVVENSSLVFAGYGIVAPEFDWDDFKDTDVRGKTVVLLDGEPAIADSHDGSELDESMFQGRAQTFYGTSSYKCQAANQRGAAAVFLVHDPDTAFASFGVMQNNYRQEAFDIKAAVPSQRHASVEGQFTIEAFQRLGGTVPLDFASLKKAAQSRAFTPMALGGNRRFHGAESSEGNRLAQCRGESDGLGCQFEK